MNYIKQLNSFHDSLLINRLSPGQIALWHALMAINNKCAWIKKFTASNQVLELTTGMSRQGLHKARNVLKQRGYIDFETRTTKLTVYTIKKLYDEETDSLSENASESIIESEITMSDSCIDRRQSVAELVDNELHSLETNSCTINKHKRNINKTKGVGGKSTRFVPPTYEQVAEYCLSRGNGINPQRFIDFYQSKGWMVGKNKMKDWKAAVRTWESKEVKTPIMRSIPRDEDYDDPDNFVLSI